MAVARLWPQVYANALDPGWVPTKMGGAGAPDDLEKGHQTQAWLAASDDAEAKVSGEYFFHKKPVNLCKSPKVRNCRMNFFPSVRSLPELDFQ